MIEEIQIRNLGVIGEATLPLGAGFTALTGETGAGKTMVITALGLLLGERADSGVVRKGHPSASAEGRWLVPAQGAVAQRVAEAGGDVDPVDEANVELLLARTVTAEGRSRALVGGRSAPVGVLADIGSELVVVHGQSEQLRLKAPAAQREALDRYAGDELAKALAEYRAVFRRWQESQGELDVLVAERDRRAREAEDLRLALDEIEAVAPQPGEDAQLDERIERLGNLEDLRLAAEAARQAVSGDLDETPAAATLLDAARRQLERVAEHDPALAPIAEAITTASFVVADLGSQLASYLGALEPEGAIELARLQERRAELAALTRKHGPSLEDVLAHLEEGSARLLELDSDSDRIAALSTAVEADRSEIVALAARVHELRVDAGERLAEEVSAELAALAMPDARVTVEVTERAEFGQSGKDQVALLLQPHPGTEPRPLGRGASGGELSRVMLAIEVVLAGTDPVPTFVFDEVDAGVGGSAAIEIGRRLARLAERSQVIVVTHLAQVAAFANNHLSVVKDSDGSVTASSVRQLSGEERTAEMARLLSGLPDSPSGLEHARELLGLSAAS
ncbi:DNA repair protein RecN [Salinibacterium sp. SYSU T00001]|uniref:DNA repair protein RecN n=1 Tax=Homoserinimonas sedimenticola TaxID=2986805 RepID=UPI00223658FE|nr:DNA repair protein RecN [Salinibacterium sedimenticola]MCW4384159.1 DNA repair protein RecN [Salinibacterium sedimenticola]